ncbi:hypothetical protein BHM03_00027747 [Ensete ventricosum]|nr:hypothetical protein BHM03_00027747 [Ensete ventricosum]
MRFRQSSLGDSPKGLGTSLGTRREIAGRRPEDSPEEYQRLPDWWECTTAAKVFGRLAHSSWLVEPLVPRNLGTLGG